MNADTPPVTQGSSPADARAQPLSGADARARRYEQALRDVVDPLGKLQRNAEADGVLLSGMAYSIANDLGFVQSIAREALAAFAQQSAPPASEGDLAAFGASEAAGYRYPGTDQSAERAAFCEGASHAASRFTPYRTLSECNTAAIRAVQLLEEAEDYHANCEECCGEGVPELCIACFPLFDKARVERRLVMQSLAALPPSSGAAQQDAGDEARALIERLRSQARRESEAHRMMAEAKSLRQPDNPEGRTDLYSWPEPEQTDSWKAAELLARLSSTPTHVAGICELCGVPDGRHEHDCPRSTLYDDEPTTHVAEHLAVANAAQIYADYHGDDASYRPECAAKLAALAERRAGPGYVMVPREPSRDAFDKLGRLWGYNDEETAETLGAILDVFADEPGPTLPTREDDHALYRKLRQKLNRVHPSNAAPDCPLQIKLTYGKIARLSTTLLSQPRGEVLSEDEFRERLRAEIRPRGIAKWSAERLLSDEQVGAFLRGKRPPEPKLLEALGMERVVSYRSVSGAPPSPVDQPRGEGISAEEGEVEPLRIDWNRRELAEAYDTVETLRRAIAQPSESSLDTSLRAALDAIEAADCEWDSITKPLARTAIAEGERNG